MAQMAAVTVAVALRCRHILGYGHEGIDGPHGCRNDNTVITQATWALLSSSQHRVYPIDMVALMSWHSLC